MKRPRIWLLIGTRRGDNNQDMLRFTVTRSDSPFTLEQTQKIQTLMQRARLHLPMTADDTGNLVTTRPSN